MQNVLQWLINDVPGTKDEAMNITFSFIWSMSACMEDSKYYSRIKSSPERTCMCSFATYTCLCVNRCVWTGVYRLWQWAVLFDACVELDRHA